ncbi:hypothetical protein [Clostridium sp. CF012]|uniref:hypothetical protein n=1 Tax=Clostridium sp. CF012 TaxID=2843319 RepID=UPI001C0D0312|nr:hypothetical protein [Clostridium sp. CF012]MBU3145749.1 hypothetical protein [Clostridium sp. CF012]
MNYKKIEDEIKEWFEDHIATFKKYDDRVSALSWGGPDTNSYYTRFVFDGSRMYVTGDIGDAVFCFTEKATIKSIITYGLDYFHGKLSALDEDKYSFDSDEAIARIREEIKNMQDDEEFDFDNKRDRERKKIVDNHIRLLRGLIIESRDCTSKSNWDYVVNQVYDDLTDCDCDAAEWIFSAGDIIPYRVQGYLIGLKMAYEQLNKEGI